MRSRFAPAFLLALALNALAVTAQDFPRVESGSRGTEELDRQAGPRPKAALGLPARAPGNPEYLVRLIYMMPTDRQPSDPTAYAAKADAAVRRIRASAEMMGDYFAAEIAKAGADGPGSRPNFERGADGRIRVLVVNGSLSTEGYWGDSTGLDSNHINYAGLADIFGSWDGATAASAKTVHLLLIDTLSFDDSGPSFAWRGYVGLGSGMELATGGYGGCCTVAYGVLEFLPLPPTDDKAGREATFRSALCDSTMLHQVGSYFGRVPGIPPTCNPPGRDLNRTELLSIFQGVIAHEFSHACAVGHDGITDELMGGGYVRYGQVIRDILGVQCEAIPITASCSGGGLGFPVAHRLSHSPYFTPITNPDKTDPAVDLAWPPAGAIYTADATSRFERLRVTASDPGGSGLSSAIVYEGGWSKEYQLHSTGQVTITSHNAFTLPVGRRDFHVQVIDRAGNLGGFTSGVFALNDSDTGGSQAWSSMLWARRPAGEDDRPRQPSAPLGSFMNPYSDLQTAIDAGGSCVLIGKGVWPIRTQLKPKYGVSICGEGVGQTILDGGGTDVNFFVSFGFTEDFHQASCANLVMRNAGAGLVGDPAADRSYHYSVVNCIFMNLTRDAVSFQGAAGSIEVSQNTVYHCGGGIRLKSYDPFVRLDRFTFRNNLVVNCTGVGIEMIDIAGMDSNPRVGGNLSFGNGTNWAGDGVGTAGSSYASHRWPGEFSAKPTFAVEPPSAPEDFKPTTTSPAVHRGLAPTENENGARRTIGAWLDDFPAAANVWMVQ